MCGRFTLRAKPAAIAGLLGLPDVPELAPRFNVAPSQRVVVAGRNAAGIGLGRFRWGITPVWDPRGLLTNARADKVAASPAFRDAFRRRRCLVLADGFYEWKAVGKQKLPTLFTLDGGLPFAFAGLYEEAEAGPACAVITTEPNELVATVHDRMPVILSRERFGLWLDPDEREPKHLLPLLAPYPADRMAATAVSTKVNSARNDGPGCVEPAA